MKFVLFNVTEANEDIIRKIQIDSKNYIYEINLSFKKLTKRVASKKSCINFIRNKIYDMRLNKSIIKLLGKEYGKWNYLFSKKLDEDTKKYLSIRLKQLLGTKIQIDNQFEKNILKYIDDYVNKNNYIKQDLKGLIVAKDVFKIDTTLLQSLIKELKNVDVYTSDKTTNYLTNIIDNINKAEGTTITCLNKDRKNFKEYDVIYFIDSNKKDWLKFRMNKNILILDNITKKKDKYNSHLLEFNTYIQRRDVDKKNMQYLCNQYNNLELAIVICKVVFAY